MIMGVRKRGVGGDYVTYIDPIAAYITLADFWRSWRY
jgi:hypothetical protein